MRSLLFAVMISIGLTGVVRADESAVRSVISAQIEAFLAGDVTRAYGYASPFIQQKFGTPEIFGTMVREGYPMVWRPSDVNFLEIEEIGGRLWQNVLVRDAGGVAHIVEYEMIEGAEGWKINGVRVRKAPESSV
ncbi:protein of unknown function [Roseovarius azorensis]|uniref:DUF4864 domain-containing protein n=1 Tax=Roseovarius azorensis TaxID=1287727 RepID=A0A1H7ULE6_9RHOB|nr:DUF4864 domain-containing protein [Roseovarius azorensis]SEL97575.1 protein of unknown function [Roseovarius azorensis]